MSPYIGYPIVIGILAVIVYFCGRAVWRDLKGSVSGEGCGGCCSSSCGNDGSSCGSCYAMQEYAKQINEKNN